MRTQVFIHCAVALIGAGLFSFAQAQPVTTGLQIHLDASDITGVSNGGAITSWADSSGNSRDANVKLGTARLLITGFE